MIGHGGQPALDWPNCMQYMRLAVVGAGAAAPVRPAGLVAALNTTPDFPVKANVLSSNVAEIPTRSGVGVYTITYDKSFTIAKVLNAPTEVYGVAGMWASVTSVNTLTRQLAVTTYAAAGAATDLPATAILVIAFECQDSNT